MADAGRAAEAFGRLYSIVARLRAPDGCPWDREQTPKTMRGSLIEEAYELVEAIDEDDGAHVREEVGDVFLLAAMVAYMNEESGAFSVADSLDGISDKLVRRHPHVFGEAEAADSEAVLAQWQEIKEKVEGRRRKDSILDEVSRALPPLERAYRIQKKAAKVGFDWAGIGEVWEKAREELDEAEAACIRAAEAGDREALEEELGDFLFSAVNLARFLKVDPAVALHGPVEKFSRRFRHVEKRMAESGLALGAPHMEKMDGYWNEAKRIEAGSGEGS
ncbi:MAG TPA: nucleoside triphosphate pyrophosphohydrolase [Rectinemataceae bacterium]|nr:nucleoside triphosphate pyrophosphohydrolase [Rectinemataceae bacterium]